MLIFFMVSPQPAGCHVKQAGAQHQGYHQFQGSCGQGRLPMLAEAPQIPLDAR
jgi:hypothetical protein